MKGGTGDPPDGGTDSDRGMTADGGTSRGGGILVVDDDRDMVRTIVDLLRLREWKVTAAYSGEEAVDAVDARPFSVVLMDIRMKGMTGVEALKRIRARRPGVRVILMTAYTTSELIEEAREEGVVEVLSKPLAVPRLLTLVEEEQSRVRGPVLVVDDNREFLKALCAGLEEAGVRTRRATHLHEALRLLEEDEEIQVVVLDLKLEKIVDVDTVYAIREIRPEVLVILFSGYQETLDELVSDLPEGAVVASLSKPFDPDRLIRILDGVHAA